MKINIDYFAKLWVLICYAFIFVCIGFIISVTIGLKPFIKEKEKMNYENIKFNETEQIKRIIELETK